MIKIRAFRAPEDEETCWKFIEGHRRLLEIHFGIVKITSSNSEWITNPNVIVVVAEDETGEKIFGGCRIQLADGINPLPIEEAIGKYDSNIHDRVNHQTCELGGLWNSMEVQGMGIGAIYLVRGCVVITSQIPTNKMYLLCAPVTVRMGKRVGALVDTSLGNNGTFYYPKEDFIATAMIHTDLKALSTADENERNIIHELRENPIQTRLEKGPKMDLEIEYNLLLEKVNTLK
jgi:hypothetical protein